MRSWPVADTGSSVIPRSLVRVSREPQRSHLDTPRDTPADEWSSLDRGSRFTPMIELVTERRRTAITDRQREVIALIAAGCSNDEVGARLGISPRTAKAHCDILRQKLGVRRRRQIPIAFRLLTGEDPLLAGDRWALGTRRSP